MTSLKDIIQLKLGRNKDDYLDKFQNSVDSINNRTHKFDDISTYSIKGKIVYKFESIASLYCARHINNLLKKLYKIKQSNRDIISKQINSLLNETSPYYIIKADITNFYESIDRNKIVVKLKNDRLLEMRNIKIIETIFSNKDISTHPGMPRGISFSSTLSELYLRSFDESIRRIPGVYYYARYVDDFIIFTHDPDLNIDKIEGELSKLGLIINRKKTHRYKHELISQGKQEITFLGYKHHIENGTNAKIKISNKRIRKIKTRIILSFLDFFKNKNISLFEIRIKFLTGNYIICTNQEKEKKLLAGFYYNNCAINDFSQISDLDRFLMRAVRSKSGFIPSCINTSLMKDIEIILSKNHFSKGFNSRTVHEIEVSEFKEIKSCWEREYIYEKQ